MTVKKMMQKMTSYFSKERHHQAHESESRLVPSNCMSKTTRVVNLFSTTVPIVKDIA